MDRDSGLMAFQYQPGGYWAQDHVLGAYATDMARRAQAHAAQQWAPTPPAPTPEPAYPPTHAHQSPVPYDSSFDGHWAWHEGRQSYGEYAFVLRDGIGICTITNSPYYFGVGSMILVVDSFAPTHAEGRQIFTLGR